QISNFKISENVTLRQLLIADSAISGAIGRINKAKGKVVDQEVYVLCSLVDSTAQNIGLNRIDAAALFWAFSYDPLLDGEKSSGMRKRTSCPAAVMAYDLGLFSRASGGN